MASEMPEALQEPAHEALLELCYTHFLNLKGILQNKEVTWGLGKTTGVSMGPGLGWTGWKGPTVGSPRILPPPGVTGGRLWCSPLANVAPEEEGEGTPMDLE